MRRNRFSKLAGLINSTFREEGGYYAPLLRKTAGDWLGMIGRAGSAVSGGVMAYNVLKDMVNKVQNDASRKRIVEDLALNDPLLKSVGKAQLLEWYATLCHYAPNMALDKQTVREVLHTFARFGKVDLSTLKTLADTEKSMSGNASSGYNFKDLASAFRGM